MLLRILKANHVYNFILVPVTGLLMILSTIMEGGTFPVSGCENVSPLCQPILNSGIPFWGAVMLNFGAVMIMCFLLLQINARFSFVKERTFLPAFLFLFIVYALPELRIIQPAFIAGIFLIMAIRSIFNSFEQRSAIRNAFDAGFFIGLTGLFYFNANLLIILVPISIYILRNTVNWREMLVPFVGLFLPWSFLFSGYFIAGKTDDLIQQISNSIMAKDKSFIEQLPVQIFFIFLILLIAISSIFILRQYGVKNINVRRYFKILFLFFISSFLLIVFPSVSSEILVFLTIPLTFLLTNYLIFVRRKIWAELFLTVLLIFAILIQFFI